MSVKNYDIKFPKQNYEKISIAFKENNEKIQLQENDLIFFSVKEHAYDKEYLIQKSLGNGISFNSSTQEYDIEITSNDTKNLLMNKKYGYDISVYYDGNKPKQKVVGCFELSDKFSVNEVV